MATNDWILQLLLGGILGMVGQGIRVLVGLKKTNEQAAQQGKAFGEVFHSSTLLLSIFIGFIAGVVAMIAITGTGTGTQLSKQMILTLLGAGYAGTDFIEGFIRKYLPVESEAGTTRATRSPGMVA